jgi:hypothetical protein
MKSWGDLWFAEGINNFCFHYFAHQPWNDRRPGVTLGPWGVHFDRHNTWFDLAGGYVEYLTRCQRLLRQGLPVMDVCRLTGNGVTSAFPVHPDLRANGYDYHGLTTELLHDLKVKDGWLTLPSGMRYRLLVTYNRELRPETLRTLRDLVKAGATVMGLKPEDAPGLAGYPDSCDETRAIAEELWGSDAAVGRKGRTCGRGKVFWGDPEKAAPSTHGCGVAAYLKSSRELEVLRDMGATPDFSYGASGKEACEAMLAYMHRRVAKTEFYFVSNQAERTRREECVFRVAGLQPELWNPVTGEMRDLPVFHEQDGRTAVPLEFEPGQSHFVVFRRSLKGLKAGKQGADGNFPRLRQIAKLDGPWELSFDPKWGGPEKPVLFAALEDWARQTDEAIKYYSGKATYRLKFDVPEAARGQRVYLDLGTVKDIAEVRLNGKSLGTVWCAPWQVEITKAARPAANELEVTVANEWVNRLIRDSALPREKRLTWTTRSPYEPNSPLLPSGLLGPVTLRVTEHIRIASAQASIERSKGSREAAPKTQPVPPEE